MQLRFKTFTFLVPLILVPFLGFWYFANQQITASAKHYASNSMSYAVGNAAKLVNHRLSRLFAAQQWYAQSESLSRLATRYITTGEFNQKQLEGYFSQLRRHEPDILGIALFDAGNRLAVASTRSEIEQWITSSAIAAEFIDGEDVKLLQFSSVIPTAVAVDIPITLVMLFSAKSLLEPVATVDATANISITDSAGKTLLSEIREIHPHFDLEKISRDPVVFIQGEKHLAFIQPVRNGAYYVVGSVLFDDIVLFGKHWNKSVPLLIVVFTILMVALIYGQMHRSIIKPILHLRLAARTIRHGQFGRRTGITSSDEIGELADEIERMSRSLDSSKKRISKLAYFDSLTGLPNRVSFDRDLEARVDYAKQHDFNIALLFVDIDNFKRVNDCFGHIAGDELLIKLSERLQSCLREATFNNQNTAGDIPSPDRDVIFRLAGDEFCVVCIGELNDARAAMIADRIIEELRKPVMIEENELYVYGSIGIALFPDHAETPEELLKFADVAMYEAKHAGKNNYKFFDDTLHQRLIRHYEAEVDIRHALVSNELLPYYQPKVDVHTGKIIGAEALARWSNAGKDCDPSYLIKVAEESGIISEVGKQMFTMVCQQIQCWQREGLACVPISVNLSARELLRDDLITFIRNTIEKYDVPPALIEFELTETTVMEDEQASILRLKQLKKMGVGLALDDFGTGYSSLSYLHRLPIDTLKIDRSFIVNLRSRSSSITILRQIISLAGYLNLNTVVEGVETQDELEVVKLCGCTKVQGYYYSKPLPLAEFSESLAKGACQKLA